MNVPTCGCYCWNRIHRLQGLAGLCVAHVSLATFPILCLYAHINLEPKDGGTREQLLMEKE